MKYTSAEAGKLLKKLNGEQSSSILREQNGKEFLAAIKTVLRQVKQTDIADFCRSWLACEAKITKTLL